jgi:hypothetical protein
MIHWNVVTEPPLLKELTNDQLWQIVDDPAHQFTEIRSLTCHTRHVKLVTEASLAVNSMDRSIGSIRARLFQKN